METNVIESGFTTNQIKKRFNGKKLSQIEHFTCSSNCKKCGRRIWFDEFNISDVPAQVECPYCNLTTDTINNHA
jgi:Zn finger protein HypA/HybF involved in hydrogenase expression